MKNLKKWKKYYYEKKSHKIILAYECQIRLKNVYLKKKKNTQNYNGPWVPNLILSYQALYITK